ncbi:MAG: methyltransferase domain-containing protein [Comamonadaceae bacterium]|nr:methyltransferase domain-containing protein [Comamonadaceae bacterium]
MTKSLDLGCGASPKNPFNADEVFGIDLRASLDRRIQMADLSVEAIPHPDGSFEFVTAFDFIEHIPRVLYMPQRRNPFIELMNEVYRVLKLNGTFFSMTPAYPNAAAFIDPTHVNIVAEGTFPLYFGDADSSSPWGIIYGFKGAFHTVSETWQGPHLLTVLQKIPLAEAPSYKNGHAVLPPCNP